MGVLIPAVREAGEIGLRFARQGAKTFTKHDASPVTEADLAIDHHLSERLRSVTTAAGWLSEEIADTSERLSKQQVWIVDPIDGTRGFVAGNGEWVISAALVEAGRPIAGVLFRPTTGDLYEATQGGGARLNGRVLRVPDGPLAAVRRLSGPKPLFDEARRRLPEAERLPSLSSLALRLAFVAEGRIDGAFAKARAKDWDVAAADLIVEEAGGLLGTVAGERLCYNRPDPTHPTLVAAGASRQAALARLIEAGA
jgi:myo-inositol-1(or 4)-monophosphatase